MENIDFDSLRSDLIDYYGSATPLFGAAYMDVMKVERASDYELIQIALSCGFDLSDYETYDYGR